jgi:mono/diheme cytochrome c family protein
MNGKNAPPRTRCGSRILSCGQSEYHGVAATDRLTAWTMEDMIATPTTDSTGRPLCERPRAAAVSLGLARLASLVLGGVVFAYAANAAEAHKIPTAPPEFLALENPIGKDQMDKKFLKKAARLYKRKCKSCHGVDGDGNGPKAETIEIKPAAFSKPGYLAGRKDGQLYWIIMNGSEGTEMEPKGPKTRANLSEREVWTLITYIRHAFTR